MKTPWMKDYRSNKSRQSLAIYRRNYKYEISSLNYGEGIPVYFTDRKPRKDSKYFSHRYLIWDLKANCQVFNWSV